MSASDGTVVGTTLIVDHGSPADRFNLVVVAEGYRQTELGQFAVHARQFADVLLAMAPFDEMQCAINVYRVDVASNQSGADDPAACGGTGAAPATYFDASFCNAGIRRLLTVDDNLVRTVVDAQVPQWHQILVVVNSPVWGGAGGDVATTSVAMGWEDVAIHEMGHSAFGLADEYEYWAGCGVDTNRDNHPGPEPAEPNVTRDSDRATIKWRDLIAAGTPMPTTSNPDCTRCDGQASPVPAGTVGAFEGAHYYHCDAFRPEYHCMMRNLAPFCAVCRREIRRTLEPFLAKCYAPTFHGSSALVCFFKTIGWVLVLLVLAPFVWISSIRCAFKRIVFRIRNCRGGNADPCREL